MNYYYAAYNHYGDLIYEGSSTRDIEQDCLRDGYSYDEFFIVKVNP